MDDGAQRLSVIKVVLEGRIRRAKCSVLLRNKLFEIFPFLDPFALRSATNAPCTPGFATAQGTYVRLSFGTWPRKTDNMPAVCCFSLGPEIDKMSDFSRFVSAYYYGHYALKNYSAAWVFVTGGYSLG